MIIIQIKIEQVDTDSIAVDTDGAHVCEAATFLESAVAEVLAVKLREIPSRVICK